MNLYVIFQYKNCVGVASTILQLSGKLCKLRLSFSLCKYVTYRRIFWQSMDNFYFLCQKAIFEKITKAIVHGFVKKRGFEVGNGIEPFYVGMCVYMS